MQMHVYASVAGHAIVVAWDIGKRINSHSDVAACPLSQNNVTDPRTECAKITSKRNVQDNSSDCIDPFKEQQDTKPVGHTYTCVYARRWSIHGNLKARNTEHNGGKPIEPSEIWWHSFSSTKFDLSSFSSVSRFRRAFPSFLSWIHHSRRLSHRYTQHAYTVSPESDNFVEGFRESLTSSSDYPLAIRAHGIETLRSWHTTCSPTIGPDKRAPLSESTADPFPELWDVKACRCADRAGR